MTLYLGQQVQSDKIYMFYKLGLKIDHGNMYFSAAKSTHYRSYHLFFLFSATFFFQVRKPIELMGFLSMIDLSMGPDYEKEGSGSRDRHME